MHTLNYHHLLYFWVTAREGSIAGAAGQLGLSQPTISAQIKSLEESLGHQLFERVGRGLRLSQTGRTAFRYADEIFGLGRELVETLEGRAPGSPLRLEVGVVDALPKLLVHADPGLIIPPDTAAWYRDQLPNTETVNVGPGLHYIQEDRPREIGRAIAGWMQRQEL